MSKLDRLLAERTETRRLLAKFVAARALESLRAKGIDIRVFGSLANGDFRLHSDIDFLVSGPIDGARRVVVECGLVEALEDSGLPYDVIYLDDLTPAQAELFSRG